MSEPLTFSFDPQHGTELDVWVPDSFQSSRPPSKVAAVLFFHGGGMTGGGKRDMLFPMWLPEKLRARGIILISANYRLLSSSTPQDLIDDTHTLFRYVASPSTPLASHLLGMGLAIDPARLVVYGNSGGNYLARAAATLPSIQPRPIGWIAQNDMGNHWILDHWVQPKDKLEITFLAREQDKVDRLLATYGGPVSTDAPLHFIPALRQVGDVHGRVGLFVHWQTEGTILDYLLDTPGLSGKLRRLPLAERMAAIPSTKRHLLLPLNRQVPPTFFIHGTEDVVIKLEESVHAYEQLETLGVRREAAWVPGAGHGLVDAVNGPPARAPGWEQAVDAAMSFIDSVLASV